MKSTALSHFVSAVVLEAESGRDGHDHGRAPVAEDVEVAVQEAFVVDDADHDQVQMDALDAHPGEGRQEEVVQQPCNNRAEELPGHTEEERETQTLKLLGSGNRVKSITQHLANRSTSIHWHWMEKPVGPHRNSQRGAHCYCCWFTRPHKNSVTFIFYRFILTVL